MKSRTIVSPVAAFTMAVLLFVYSRTSIKAAKRNAERHRSADGGQISWQNENLRRHGVLNRPRNDGALKTLMHSATEQVGDVVGNVRSRSNEEDSPVVDPQKSGATRD